MNIKTIIKFKMFYLNKGLILSLGLTLSMFLLNVIVPFIEYENIVETINTLTNIAGALIGFHIAGISIYYAIPFNERIKKNIEKSSYDLVIPRAFYLSIITFMLCLAFYMLSSNIIVVQINFYLIICGFWQTFFCARLLYVLGIKHNK